MKLFTCHRILKTEKWCHHIPVTDRTGIGMMVKGMRRSHDEGWLSKLKKNKNIKLFLLSTRARYQKLQSKHNQKLNENNCQRVKAVRLLTRQCDGPSSHPPTNVIPQIAHPSAYPLLFFQLFVINFYRLLFQFHPHHARRILKRDAFWHRHEYRMWCRSIWVELSLLSICIT